MAFLVKGEGDIVVDDFFIYIYIYIYIISFFILNLGHCDVILVLLFILF